MTASEPNDAVHGEVVHGKPGRPPFKGAHKKYSQPTDTDLTTGHCMTCDSMVRWPKDLKAFRCTICLMINDLKPVVTSCFESGPGNGPPSQSPAFEKGDQPLAKQC